MKSEPTGFGGRITISLRAKRSTRRAGRRLGEFVLRPPKRPIPNPVSLFSVRAEPCRSLLLESITRFIDEFRCRSVAAAGDSLFFCFAKSKVSKRKGDPQSGSLRFATGTLRCSEQTEILETCLLRSLRTSKIFNPSAPALLSPARTGWGKIEFGFGFAIRLF